MKSCPKIFSQKSFTLMEIIVTIFVISLMAAFAIPRYTRAIERSRYRNAKVNLYAIYTASEMYKSSTGTYVFTGTDTSEINSSLRLDIQDPDFQYAMSGQTISAFTATATRASIGPTYSLEITDGALNSSNPSCTSNPAALCVQFELGQ